MLEIVFMYQKKGQDNTFLTKTYLTNVNDFWKLDEKLSDSNYRLNLLSVVSIDNIYNISDKFTLDMAIKVAEEDYYTGISEAICRLRKFGIDTSVYDCLSKIEELYEEGCFIRDLQYKVLGIYDIMQKAYDIVFDK